MLEKYSLKSEGNHGNLFISWDNTGRTGGLLLFIIISMRSIKKTRSEIEGMFK